MVYMKKYFKFAIFGIILLYFKNVNNSQKLAIISFVMNFYSDHFLRQKDK